MRSRRLAARGRRRRSTSSTSRLRWPTASRWSSLSKERDGRRRPPARARPVPGGKVHLNSATVEQLDELPGVGPVTAQQILDYREANGAFRSIDELDAVPGIGPARLEQLRPLVDL